MIKAKNTIITNRKKLRSNALLVSMTATRKKTEARQILAKVHGFSSLSKGHHSVLEILKKHPCIQVDPIDVAGCNHDLTLFSRVEDYRQKYLRDLLYEKRHLFEYYCKMLSILPVETYRLFKFKMQQRQEKYRSFFNKYSTEVEEIMQAAENGPVCSKDIRNMGKVKWSWGQTARVSNTLLSRLWYVGKLMIHHREGRTRYYGVSEDIIPEEQYKKAAMQKDESLTEIAHLIVRSSRIVSPSKAPEQWTEVGKTGKVRMILNTLESERRVFSVRIEGWSGKLYCPIEDKPLWGEEIEPDDSFVRFLAPLDPLLWNRALFECVYGNKYVWEVYKKKEERVYGYYCLPILFDGDYIGLIEPYYRSDDNTLEIRSFHLFESLSTRRSFVNSLKTEIHRFMDYLGAERLENNSQHAWLDGIA